MHAAPASNANISDVLTTMGMSSGDKQMLQRNIADCNALPPSLLKRTLQVMLRLHAAQCLGLHRRGGSVRLPSLQALDLLRLRRRSLLCLLLLAAGTCTTHTACTTQPPPDAARLASHIIHHALAPIAATLRSQGGRSLLCLLSPALIETRVGSLPSGGQLGALEQKPELKTATPARARNFQKILKCQVYELAI